jgi:hypothetical protein
MTVARSLLAAAVISALLAAPPAEAKRRRAAARAPARQAVALGLGADWLADPERGALQLTLAVETPIARHVTVGGRVGAGLVSDPGRFAVPLDLRLRARLGRVYLDGLAGPWIVVGDGDALRLHAAAGFGLLGGGASFGLEVGYLDPGPMIGVRLAFPI